MKECARVGLEVAISFDVMTGDGEARSARESLSSFGRSGVGTHGGGGEPERRGHHSGRQDEYSLHMEMLSSLSRNGLSLLAGAGGGGLSSKPLAVGMPRLRSLASNGASAECGAGYSGFTGYRAARVVRPALQFGSHEEMKVKEEVGTSSSHQGTSIGDKVDQTDVQKLTADECWRLTLKLGTQWPALNEATTSQATQGLMQENDSTFEVSDRGRPSHYEERVQGKRKLVTLQRGQDFLKLLATRALEALAQTPPDHHGRAARGMLAPKQTTQKVMNSKAPGDAREAPIKVTEPAKAPCSSRETFDSKNTSRRPRTAPLTIFYDGIVNVCDNVPADKARLIMMFAEKAGVSPNAQPFLRSVSIATPSLQPSVRVTPPAISQEPLQYSKPSPQVASLAGTSSVPSDLPPSAIHGEGSTSDREPAQSSNPAKVAISELCSMPRKITITTEDNSRHHVFVKPLPNARKNSLARFLDSRKRGSASRSEGGSPKKQALEDGCCPSDLDQEFNASG